MHDMRVDGNSVTSNLLMSARFREPKQRPSGTAIHEVLSHALSPTTRSYNTAIAACERAQDWAASVALFHDM
eukprot:5757479-Amphidinium_carterae.1